MCLSSLLLFLGTLFSHVHLVPQLRETPFALPLFRCSQLHEPTFMLDLARVPVIPALDVDRSLDRTPILAPLNRWASRSSPRACTLAIGATRVGEASTRQLVMILMVLGVAHTPVKDVNLVVGRARATSIGVSSVRPLSSVDVSIIIGNPQKHTFQGKLRSFA